MFFVIAGLGNPGPTYRNNRHNIGFRVVMELARRHGFSFVPADGRDRVVAEGLMAGQECLLVLPMAFMNRSGIPLAQAITDRPVEWDRLGVIHDDIDLALGRIQVRQGGGDGGHRGIRSLVETLATQDFVRFRLGVGRRDPGIEASEHVLDDFPEEEAHRVKALIERSCDAVECWLTNGLVVTRNRFNRWERPKKEEEEDREQGQKTGA